MSISVNSFFCCQYLSSKFSDHHVDIISESICNFLWIIRFFLNRICLVFFECIWSSSETSFLERLRWEDFVTESSRMMLILYCDWQSEKATSRSLHSVSTFVRSLQSGLRRREYSDLMIQLYWFSSQYEKKCADGKENSIWSRQTVIVKFINILHASWVLNENVRVWLKAEALKLDLLIAMKIADASVMW